MVDVVVEPEDRRISHVAEGGCSGSQLEVDVARVRIVKAGDTPSVLARHTSSRCLAEDVGRYGVRSGGGPTLAAMSRPSPQGRGTAVVFGGLQLFAMAVRRSRLPLIAGWSPP
jgi:hypothetical protein